MSKEYFGTPVAAQSRPAESKKASKNKGVIAYGYPTPPGPPPPAVKQTKK